MTLTLCLLYPKRAKQNLWVLLFLVAFSVHGQTNTAQPGAKLVMGELKGAELFANLAGHGEVHVFLKAYYSCTASIPANEHVSLFESMGNRLVTVLELKKDTEFVQPGNTSTPCFPDKENCIRQVVYSLKTNLGLAYMDYDLSWAYCCFDRGVINLDLGIKQGIALLVHLPNPAIAEPNHTAFFKQLPVNHLCNNTSTSFMFSVNNTDSDEVSIKMSQPFHYNVPGQPEYNYPSGKTANLNQVIKNPVFEGSFLTNHPPFELIRYATGYSAGKPFLSGDFKLDSRTGKADIKATGFGKFLIEITLEEKRNNKLIAEHAFVFITEIR